MENQNLNQQGDYSNQPPYAPQMPEIDSQKKKNKKVLIPFLITLLASIVIIASLFTPYITVNEQYESFPGYDFSYGTQIADLDGLDKISLFEFAEIGFKMGHEYIIAAGIIVILAVFMLLIFLFALIKKPIPLLIFCILTTLLYFIQCRIFIASGISSSGYYTWGIAYYSIYAALAVNFVGSIIMMIVRSRQ